MEIKHLRLIKTIADEKGIAKSLDKLFLSQSAVSHQLKDIEEEMGVKIFYRTKNIQEAVNFKEDRKPHGPPA